MHSNVGQIQQILYLSAFPKSENAIKQLDRHNYKQNYVEYLRVCVFRNGASKFVPAKIWILGYLHFTTLFSYIILVHLLQISNCMQFS